MTTNMTTNTGYDGQMANDEHWNRIARDTGNPARDHLEASLTTLVLNRHWIYLPDNVLAEVRADLDAALDAARSEGRKGAIADIQAAIRSGEQDACSRNPVALFGVREVSAILDTIAAEAQ